MVGVPTCSPGSQQEKAKGTPGPEVPQVGAWAWWYAAAASLAFIAAMRQLWFQNFPSLAMWPQQSWQQRCMEEDSSQHGGQEAEFSANRKGPGMRCSP